MNYKIVSCLPTVFEQEPQTSLVFVLLWRFTQDLYNPLSRSWYFFIFFKNIIKEVWNSIAWLAHNLAHNYVHEHLKLLDHFVSETGKNIFVYRKYCRFQNKNEFIGRKVWFGPKWSTGFSTTSLLWKKSVDYILWTLTFIMVTCYIMYSEKVWVGHPFLK